MNPMCVTVARDLAITNFANVKMNKYFQYILSLLGVLVFHQKKVLDLQVRASLIITVKKSI